MSDQHLCYRDPRTGKWVRARYVAERYAIAARYAEFEVIGDSEIRNVDPDARYSAPQFNVMMNAELRRFRERLLSLQPTLDTFAVFLVRLGLVLPPSQILYGSIPPASPHATPEVSINGIHSSLTSLASTIVVRPWRSRLRAGRKSRDTFSSGVVAPISPSILQSN